MANVKTFQPSPSKAPPVIQDSLLYWIGKNLFSSPLNILLTLTAVFLLIKSVPPILDWLVFSADWVGSRRIDCSGEGACWVFIRQRFIQLMAGLYYGAHPEQTWRPLLVFILLVVSVVPLFIEHFRYKPHLAIFILTVMPLVGFGLIHGDWFGLPVANTSLWGGFMLTFILSVVSIIFALPLGILLALGRRSQLTFVSKVSVVYIEFWRGSPLISILFMASVMLPLFLPSEVDIDKTVRAIVGITLFQSAYIAEVVRGGLAAVDTGQGEAADALGLSYPKKMIFIILPQALTISIPGIVNTFITLLKDTSLVAIIGLTDLLGMAQITSRSLEWRGLEVEAFLFAAFVFWICCYSMSKFSQRLERKLDTGHKS